MTKSDKDKVNQRVIAALARAEDATIEEKARLIETVRREAELEVESSRNADTVRPPAF